MGNSTIYVCNRLYAVGKAGQVRQAAAQGIINNTVVPVNCGSRAMKAKAVLNDIAGIVQQPTAYREQCSRQDTTIIAV